MARRSPIRFGAVPAVALASFAALTAVATPAADVPVVETATNLRVLPASIRPQDLDVLMKRYARDLGVQCSFCHTENAATGRADFAADDSPAKQTARLMIAMVDDINSRYIARLGDARYIDPVTCGSCHRGNSTPDPVAAR